jgi:dolichol-phosphate mannosyltransferase
MILIMLPAYNEEESLHVLMPKIEAYINSANEDVKLLVCDDGSSDRTLELLNEYSKRLPLDIIAHNINRGLGETARDLFEKAASITKADDIIIRLDCDDTHEPEIIPSMINKVREGYDVVIASRFEPGGGQKGVSSYRAFISRSANLFMKVFFPIPGLKEYSCGFRAYKASIIQSAIAFYGNDFVQLKGLGFTCTLEKLVKLKLIGAKFGEVPFMLRYDQKVSESKMVSSVTTWGYLTMALLYHWPFGGWRRTYKAKYKSFNKG